MSQSSYLHWSQFEGKPLRCDLCGDQIGVYQGDPPDPNLVVSRCFACAVTTEAEKATREAAGS